MRNNIIGTLDWDCCSRCVNSCKDYGGCLREKEIDDLVEHVPGTDYIICEGYKEK